MKKKVTNNGGVTAIYVRRSVADRDNNSLSIESQKEDCIRYVGEDCVYRLYCDNGFSGKDTEHRPAFQQMMSDAREGLISRIVVKKYDRFSRNMREYLNITDELDRYGVFAHKDNDRKTYVKVGYHEGLVDSKTWLAVQDKKSHNRKFPNNGKAKRSWLVGMLKCPHCGYSIQLNIQHNKERTKTWRYLIDFGFSTAQGCRKRTLKTKLDDVEEAVYIAMCDKIKSLEVARHEEDTPDAETESLKAEILKYDDDIHKLMDKLPDADEVLFAYIQKRIKEFHKAKSKLESKLQMKSRKHRAIDTKPLKEPLKNWDSLTIDAEHEIAVMMIDAVYLSDEDGIHIQFCI